MLAGLQVLMAHRCRGLAPCAEERVLDRGSRTAGRKDE